MESDENSQDFVDSDTDAETNSQLLETDTEILLSILPVNVWAYTFKKLEKKQPSSLDSLSKSSLYFRNVILSKRVLFLFPQVIKLIGPEFANQKNTRNQGSNIIKSRIICKDWNKAADHFITDGTLQPDFFNTEPPQPSDHALVNARYQYFGHQPPNKLTNFLSHFEQTHSPHSSRNPFIGKVLHIDLTGFTDRAEWHSIADQVTTVLRKYGHHIKILNLALFPFNTEIDVQLQNHCFLLECLGYCQNLTHLKVSEQFNLVGEIDVAFGERPDPRRRRRRPGQEVNVLYNVLHNYEDDHEIVRDREVLPHYLDFMRPRVNLPRPQYPVMGDRDFHQNVPRVHPNIAGLGLLIGLEHYPHYHYHHHLDAPLPRQVVPRIRPVDGIPLITTPILEDLQCLKLCQLSHHNFNSLISANPHVTWLQIEALSQEKRKYDDYHSMDFPNLKKLFIKLCCPEEVRKLRNVHQSWSQLTHLHFEYCTSEWCCFGPPFMEWIEIFGVISQKWGNSLTDLKLRLPMARNAENKQKIVRDSGQFRLYLPRLKKLKIWLSDRPFEPKVAKTDFLDLLRVGLEQLIIEEKM